MEQEIILLMRSVVKFFGVLIGLCGMGIAIGVLLGTIVKVFMWMI